MIPGFYPEIKLSNEKTKDSKWFIVKDNCLLVKINSNELYNLPDFEEIEKIKTSFVRIQTLGVYNTSHCFSAEFKNDAIIPARLKFFNIRKLWGLINSDLFHLAGYANQIVTWDQTFQYCGRCGTKTRNLENERAKVCPKCDLINYPRISPSIIVAVVKNNEILLARPTHFKSKMYSVLAGFVEVGENLEECVHREVKEEVNIEIKNLRYFSSQSWPFPHSLMIGFTADYNSGEIRRDANEIAEANWFSVGNLPKIPERLSIARSLIDWFITESSK